MSLLQRILYALLAFGGTFLVAWILLGLLSALIPGVTINATGWALFLGVVAGLIHFFSPRRG